MNQILKLKLLTVQVSLNYAQMQQRAIFFFLVEGKVVGEQVDCTEFTLL
jgi:hypothetical protein